MMSPITMKPTYWFACDACPNTSVISAESMAEAKRLARKRGWRIPRNRSFMLLCSMCKWRVSDE